LRIAVDIDGVLTNETEGHDYKTRTPNFDNINKVRKAYHDGHAIILFTSRFSQDRKVTIQWLKKYGVPFHKLILDKPQYDHFVDDKASSDFPEDL